MSQPRNWYYLKLFSPDNSNSSSLKDVLLFSKFLESIVKEEKKKTSCGSATESHLILFMVMNTKNFN